MFQAMHGIVETLMRAHRFFSGLVVKIVKQEMTEILLVAMRQVIIMIDTEADNNNCLI